MIGKDHRPIRTIASPLPILGWCSSVQRVKIVDPWVSPFTLALFPWGRGEASRTASALAADWRGFGLTCGAP